MKPSLRYTLMTVPVFGVAVVGFALGRYTAPVSTEAELVEIEAPVVTNDNRDQILKNEFLSKKLLDAESKIKELNAEIDNILGKDLPIVEQVAEKPSEENKGDRAQRAPHESRAAEMERLKTEDPAKYAELVKAQEEREKRHQEFQEKRRTSEAKRDDFFANVNIAYMSTEEQQSLATFVGEYQELRSLVEQQRTEENPDRGKAWQLGMSVMQKSTAIRSSLLKATAKEMGFNETESAEFSESINQIFGATSLMGPGGIDMHGMTGRGGRGGRGQ